MGAGRPMLVYFWVHWALSHTYAALALGHKLVALSVNSSPQFASSPQTPVQSEKTPFPPPSPEPQPQVLPRLAREKHAKNSVEGFLGVVPFWGYHFWREHPLLVEPFWWGFITVGGSSSPLGPPVPVFGFSVLRVISRRPSEH